jgi:hypothetical protein
MRRLLPAVSLLACTACAVRLGGSGPEEYRVLAMAAPPSASAASVAAAIKEANAQIVLLTAERDSAWFAEIATATGLALSGPGRTEPAAKAFYTNLEILGDTSIVLNVSDSTRLHVHDALYQIEKDRHVDLMFARIAPESDLRGAVRTLLSYVATDVGADAALAIAVDAPTPQAGDSVAVLLRALYPSARECAGTEAAGTGSGRVQLFYGPSARVRCLRARPLATEGTPITADLVVGR